MLLAVYVVKKDLTMNKWNRIVSVKKHKTAKKEKRLEKYGYFAEKGKFGYVRHGGKTRKNKSRKNKKRGGAPAEYPAAFGPVAAAAAVATETTSTEVKE